MKEELLEILNSSDYALSIEQVQSALHITTPNELQELLKLLSTLEDEGVIYHSNKDKYMLLEKSHLKKGMVRANKKGFGFVEVEGLKEDIFIREENMNGAIHNDLVLVEITVKKELDRMEGRILKILKRQTDTFVGEIYFKKGIGHIILDDKKVKLDIEIPKLRLTRRLNTLLVH